MHSKNLKLQCCLGVFIFSHQIALNFLKDAPFYSNRTHAPSNIYLLSSSKALGLRNLFKPKQKDIITTLMAQLRWSDDSVASLSKYLQKQSFTDVLQNLLLKISQKKITPPQVFSCKFCKMFMNTFLTKHTAWSVQIRSFF